MIKTITLLLSFHLMANLSHANPENVRAKSLLKEGKYDQAAEILLSQSMQDLTRHELRDRYSLLMEIFIDSSEQLDFDALYREIINAEMRDLILTDHLVRHARIAYERKNWQEALRRYNLIFEMRQSLVDEKYYVDRNGQDQSLDSIEYERVRSACNIRPETLVFFDLGNNYLKKYKSTGEWEDEITFQLAWRKFHNKPQEAVTDLNSFIERFPQSKRRAFACTLLFRLLPRLERYNDFFLAVRKYGLLYTDSNTRSEILMNAFLVFRRTSKRDDSPEYLDEDLEAAFFRLFLKTDPARTNMVQRMEQMMLLSKEPDIQGALADINYHLHNDPAVFERADPLTAGNFGALQYLYAYALYHHSSKNSHQARHILDALINNEDYKKRKNPFYAMSYRLLNQINEDLAQKLEEAAP